MKLDIRKYIRCLLFVLPFLLSSCNQEDDINEIFVSGQWQLVNYYTGIDWNNYNANAKPTYNKRFQHYVQRRRNGSGQYREWYV